jgi:hypothetical protein
MEKENAIKIFNDVKVRIHWDDENEKWYFAVVDVIAILTESENPQVYWRVLKKRLSDEGNETVTNCNTLKMQAVDTPTKIPMRAGPFHHLPPNKSINDCQNQLTKLIIAVIRLPTYLYSRFIQLGRNWPASFGGDWSTYPFLPFDWLLLLGKATKRVKLHLPSCADKYSILFKEI